VRGADPPAAAVTLAGLDRDPHPLLAAMRAAGPVCWVPALGAWLVTGYQCAVDVLRDARTFTVDDPRFSTAKVVGPSMLSLDGAQHARHRAPFSRAFRSAEVYARLASFTQAEAGRLVSVIAPRGEAELRRAVAGPLAAAVMAEALGLGDTDPAQILAWYDGIVAAVQAEAALQAETGGRPQTRPGGTAGQAGLAAFAGLAASLREVIATAGHQSLLAEAAAMPKAIPQTGTEADAGSPLTADEAISNAAVLMFGGIETTEGMIANAALHLLTHPGELDLVRADPSLIPAAVEESLRLEPAAAVVDRYATSDALLGGVRIPAGEQVTVSIAAANRDPAVFADPDRYEVRRANASRHLAFAHGPHFCLGAHLARLEAQLAIQTLLDQLPELRLDDRSPAAPRGLVFRKPPDLLVRWNLP
jgi:cytochrome P450